MSLPSLKEIVAVFNKEPVPHNLRPYILGDYSSIASCPESINVSGTKLDFVIRHFDRVARATYRKLPSDSWLEIYQNGYDVEGDLVMGPINKGGEAKSSFILRNANEPRTDRKKIYIQSHPTPQIYSPDDLASLCMGKNPDIYFGNEDHWVVPPLRAFMLRTIQGDMYMALATEETPTITSEQALQDGIGRTDEARGTKRRIIKSIWDELKENYPLTSEFVGINTRTETNFPIDATERGIELINYQWALDVSEKYQTPIYRAPRGRSLFRRTTTVQDHFKRLA